MFNKNDAFDTDVDFTRTLDRLYSHCERSLELDPEYELTMEDMEYGVTSMNPFKAPGPD